MSRPGREQEGKAVVGNGRFFLSFSSKSEAAFDVRYLRSDTTQVQKDDFWKLSVDYMRINPYVVRTVEKHCKISGRSVVPRASVRCSEEHLHLVHPVHMLNSK